MTLTLGEARPAAGLTQKEMSERIETPARLIGGREDGAAVTRTGRTGSIAVSFAPNL